MAGSISVALDRATAMEIATSLERASLADRLRALLGEFVPMPEQPDIRLLGTMDGDQFELHLGRVDGLRWQGWPIRFSGKVIPATDGSLLRGQLEVGSIQRNRAILRAARLAVPVLLALVLLAGAAKGALAPADLVGGILLIAILSGAWLGLVHWAKTRGDASASGAAATFCASLREALETPALAQLTHRSAPRSAP